MQVKSLMNNRLEMIKYFCTVCDCAYNFQMIFSPLRLSAQSQL